MHISCLALTLPPALNVANPKRVLGGQKNRRVGRGAANVVFSFAGGFSGVNSDDENIEGL